MKFITLHTHPESEPLILNPEHVSGFKLNGRATRILTTYTGYDVKESLDEILALLNPEPSIPDTVSTSDPVAKPFQLEAGRRYVSRCGLVSEPLIKVEESEGYGGFLNGTCYFWELNGAFDIREHDYDLISEYVEPLATAVAKSDTIPESRTLNPVSLALLRLLDARDVWAKGTDDRHALVEASSELDEAAEAFDKALKQYIHDT